MQSSSHATLYHEGGKEDFDGAKSANGHGGVSFSWAFKGGIRLPEFPELCDLHRFQQHDSDAGQRKHLRAPARLPASRFYHEGDLHANHAMPFPRRPLSNLKILMA